MKPESFGRNLGIGVRVAARIVQQKAADAAAQRAPHSEAPVSAPPGRAPAVAEATRNIADKTRALGRGSRRFGQAFFGPFVHAGGVLWLEITGLFFALFTLYFAQNVYQLRSAWRTGAEHQRFLLYAALTLVFVYFTASSFYRARRKEKRKRP